MNANECPRLYGVIGNPITHSLSPILHNTAFQHLGIPGVLLPWSIAPENLPLFMNSIRLLGIRGVAVTLPHKSPILALADQASRQARLVGAANLLYRDGDAICADNTDVGGFLDPLEKIPLCPDTKALLLGAGGASRAGVVGLLDRGLRDIFVTSPSGTTADRLAGEFGIMSIPWKERCDVAAGVIINSTPSGMKGKFEEETPYPLEWMRGRSGVAYDMVYTPLHTRFLREARQAGWETITGLEMFIGQANRQFLTWTGHQLPDCALETVKTALYGKKHP